MKQKATEQRKVSKIGNLDKYDNVKALFGKGLPLPMQHGPPPGTAARLRDLEGETASEGIYAQLDSADAHATDDQHHPQRQHRRANIDIKLGRTNKESMLQTEEANSSLETVGL